MVSLGRAAGSRCTEKIRKLLNDHQVSQNLKAALRKARQVYSPVAKPAILTCGRDQKGWASFASTSILGTSTEECVEHD